MPLVVVAATLMAAAGCDEKSSFSVSFPPLSKDFSYVFTVKWPSTDDGSTPHVLESLAGSKRHGT